MAEPKAPPVVPVFTSTGDYAEVPEDKYEEALQYGGIRPASKKEVDEYFLKQDAENSPIRAGLEGAARSFTYGLSDYGLQAAGVPQDALRARAETAPGKVGELGADVLSLAIPGGSLIKAGKLAKAGVVAGTVSEAARAAVGVNKAIAKGGEAVVRAVEKAGAGQAPSLARKVLAKTMGGAAEGALYGARNAITEDALGNNELTAESLTANAGFGALVGGGTTGTLSVLGAGLKSLGKTARGAASNFVKLEGKTAADLAEEEAFSALRPNKTAIKNTDVATRKEVGRYLLDEKLAHSGATVDDVVKGVEKRQAEYGPRIREIYNELDNVAAKPDANVIGARIQNEIIAPLEANPFLRPEAAKVKAALQGFADDFIRPGAQKAEVPYVALWDHTKALGEKINWNKTDTGLNKALSEVRAIIKQEIQNAPSETLGKELAAELKALNKKYSLAERAREIGQNTVDAMDSASSLSLTDKLVGGAGMVAGAVTGGIPGAIAGAGLAYGSKLLKERGRMVAAGMLDDISKLGVLERGQNQLIANVKSAVRGLFEGAKKIPVRTSVDTTFGALSPRYASNDKKESRKDAAIRRINEVRDLVASPEHLMTSMAERTRHLQEVAPNTSFAIQQTALRGANFLNSVLPKDPTEGMSITPLAPSRWQPTGLEIAKAMRYIRAVEDPKSVLDSINNGSVSIEEMDALRAVYPNMFTEVVNAIYEQASSRKTPLSYNQKVQLSIITGTPMDPTLEPKFIASMQQTFAEVKPQQQGRPPSGGEGVQSLASASTTQGQKVGIYK